jgi:DNA-binding phage protein
MKQKKRKSRKKDIRDIIADNIRETAEDREISLNRLADEAQVSRSQLFNVLACKSSPTVEWMDRVAKALKVDVVALVGGVGWLGRHGARRRGEC